MAKQEHVYLISHANSDGTTGVAQAKIVATNETEAREKFAELYPQRVLRQVDQRVI